MNMGERMLGLRRQRLNNSWDVCTALLRGWLRVWRSIAPQRCMLCGAVSQKLAIARTVEASNPPTDPYSSQRTHTGNNRPLLHAWTTLELTDGPTATWTAPPAAVQGALPHAAGAAAYYYSGLHQTLLSGDGVVPHHKEVRDLFRVRFPTRAGHEHAS